MSGWVKNWANEFFGKSIVATAILGAFSAAAHVPQTGQISRFQPNMLRAQKPFQVKGSVTVLKTKASTHLLWIGPSHYQLSMTGLPKGVYATEGGTGNWTLTRDGKACVLKVDAINVNCGPASVWAMLELSGQPDLATKSLVASGLYRESDAAYKETDIRQIDATSTSERRVNLVVGQNGTAPVALLEIRGDRFVNEVPGEEYPLIQFDQTFLSPMLLRAKSDGDVVTIQAAADLEVGRGKPRFSHIIASRLDVSSAKVPWASFSRQEPEATSVREIKMSKAITDLQGLRNQLSPEGQSFLRALLLTH